jgi:hypothetical protein
MNKGKIYKITKVRPEDGYYDRQCALMGKLFKWSDDYLQYDWNDGTYGGQIELLIPVYFSGIRFDYIVFHKIECEEVPTWLAWA